MKFLPIIAVGMLPSAFAWQDSAAHVAAGIRRRQETGPTSSTSFPTIPTPATTQTPSPTSGVSSSASPTSVRADYGPVCTSELQAAEDTLPTAPPQLEEFSKSYYQTATRTATATWADCAWVTNIPDTLSKPMATYVSNVEKWLNDPKNSGDARPLVRCIQRLDEDEKFCNREWSKYYSTIGGVGIGGSGGTSGGGNVANAAGTPAPAALAIPLLGLFAGLMVFW